MMRCLVLVAAIVPLGVCSCDPIRSSNIIAPAENVAAGAAATHHPAPAPDATPALAIDGEGLRLFNRATGSARPIPFETPRKIVMAALAFRGPPDLGTLEECGTGPLGFAAWPDGLKLYFQDEKLVGWAADDRANHGGSQSPITTAAGIGPGSTRTELEAAYAAKVFASPLGTEFSAGDLFGLLDGVGTKARIINMWAGASCNMR